jgi:excisionase family DNA binding protein
VKTLTTIEAGARLGVSPRRVRALISAGQLPADKKGRDYFIDPKDLAPLKHRKPGRPKKKRKF